MQGMNKDKDSDLDLLIAFEDEKSIGGFEFIGRMMDIEEFLENTLGIKVHLATERQAMNSSNREYVKKDLMFKEFIATSYCLGDEMSKTSIRYYFAYGSNMDQAQMKVRCPGAVLVGTAKLCGYRFIINSRGVATVIPEASSEVYGVLWTVTEADERLLDKYEGVKWGTYKKTEMYVERDKENSVLALIYLASVSTPGSPRDNYMEKIVTAAEQCGLPNKYIEELRSWLKTAD